MSPNGFRHPAAVFDVHPVVDYEPPAYGGPPVLPPVTAAVHETRRTPPPPDPPSDECRGLTQAAATFADAALRRILEVVDRRRPLTQLRPLLAAGLVDSLLSGAARHGPGVARLRRVHAQLTGPDARAAEVAAQYTRGGHVHAIACRVEQLNTPTGPRWQVVALHMG